MVIALMSLVLAASLVDPTGVSDFQAPPPAIDEPTGDFEPARWLNLPSVDEAMPGFAANIGISGRVGLSCWVEEQGLPQGCEVVNAAPEGLGFEAAALEGARTGVLRPAMLNGVPIRRTVAFNFRFSVDSIEDSPWQSTPYEGSDPTPTALALARQIVLQGLEESMRSEEEVLLDGLAPDRREIVRAWLRELRPLGGEDFIRNQTLMIARLSPEAEMAAYLANGTLPSSPPPTPEQTAVATSDIGSADDEAIWIEVRNRYCARWSCAIPEMSD
ncbi:MAG: energy transducer TonB [Brevundimonas sp.]|uniref:energy transducer TonB n=1 Tax=Brevundimonas sp. TaxID=1871086 RepID=UPI0024893D26|nr:energy transducer TonB [Brevundimonas sp.]MDI1327284.1 energy transducer TonB [Brevundimonas sp.]